MQDSHFLSLLFNSRVKSLKTVTTLALCIVSVVEQRKQPTLRGHPTAVVQYNSWKGGALLLWVMKLVNTGSSVQCEAMKQRRSVLTFSLSKFLWLVEKQIWLCTVMLVQRWYQSFQGRVDVNVLLLMKCLDLTEAAEAMLAENPPERLEAISEALKSHVLGLHLGTHSIMKYFHNLNQTSMTTSNDICTQDASSLSPSGLHLADPQIDTYEDEARTGHEMPTLYPVADETEVCKARFEFIFQV
ncbi:UNVERIFIED_CONTAM: DNA polymerase eta [Sesamum angustifolium]|uniref:DNA polymerase eta n=1 Tax=Sesamum angustifolium TaxID=2727405 RepID=A0AAW2PAR3_9LAMI